MSTAGNSYEAWKESFIQAEPECDDPSIEERALAASGGLNSLVDMKGVYTGLLLGLGLLFAGLAVLAPNFNHLARGKRTVGTVVGHKDFINRRSNNLVAPIVRYSAPGGVRDFEGRLSVDRSLYPLDKEVWVRYLPNNPRSAVIADFVQLFMIPAIVGSLGLICLTGTAVLMFFVARRELPPSTAPAFNYGQTHVPPATSAPPPAGSAAA